MEAGGPCGAGAMSMPLPQRPEPSDAGGRLSVSRPRRCVALMSGGVQPLLGIIILFLSYVTAGLKGVEIPMGGKKNNPDLLSGYGSFPFPQHF